MTTPRPGTAARAVRLGLLLAFMTFSAASAADKGPALGVGVTASPLVNTKPVKPGGTTTITPILVMNTGTAPEDIALSVQNMHKQMPPELPAKWITIHTTHLKLKPGGRASVKIGAHVPDGVKKGVYTTDVVATAAPMTSNNSGSARFGAASAAIVHLTVAAAPASAAVPRNALIGGAAALLVLILTGVALARRRRNSSPR